MVKAILGKLFVSCLLLYTCAQMNYFYENVDETRSSLNHECNGTITESIRSIEISYNEIFNDFSHLCALYVENATYFHFMFFQKPTELNENFYNVTGLINILVYDYDPNNGGLPVEELKDFEVNRVAVVPGDRIWLDIRLNIDDIGSATADFDDIHWSVSYVAVTNDSLPFCDSSGLEETDNGVYIVRNNTFGSVADLDCSEGYVLDDSTRLAVCSVVQNVLRWIPGTALCSSVCEHPPNVAHANMYPRMDTRFTAGLSRAGGLSRHFTEALSEPDAGQQVDNTSRTSSLTTENVQIKFSLDRNNDSSTEIYNLNSNTTSAGMSSSRTNGTQRGTSTLSSNTTSTRTNRLRTSARATLTDTLRTNVTVHYTCIEPYILRGLDRIHCGFDPSGVPHWFDQPPTCIIPDCSQTITLREHSGAIVNPSYPELTLIGGSKICRWEISAADDITILISPIYVHLPDILGVEVNVFDSGMAMLHLTNQSHLQNVTSETSRVTVIYHGPSQDIAGYQGFYIQYLMKPRGGGMRRAEENFNVVVKATDSSSSTVKEQDYTPTMSFEPLTTAQWEFSSADNRTDLATQTDNSQDFLKSSTGDTTMTSEIITPQYSEQHNSQTSIQPTSQGIDGIAKHTREVPTNSTTQQIINNPTEDFTSSPGKTSSEVANQSVGNITTLPVTFSSENDNSTFTDDTDDSSDDWKIAVGVIIPLCALILVLICVFVCFRRKYPVRMMIGRDVVKVCNPQYPQPVEHPALVRKDASQFFSKRQSPISSKESAPEKEYVVFENLGFSGDDDDEGQEPKFIETKNWLVNETKRVLETNTVNMVESYSESEISGTDTLPGKTDYVVEKAEKQIQNVGVARSMVPCRFNSKSKLAETDTSDSNSGIFISLRGNHGDDEHSGSETTHPTGAGQFSITDEDSGRTSPSSYKSESIHVDSEITLNKRGGQDGEDEEVEESGFMKTSMILFQQPTFEEVWAQVKARSRSLTLDRPVMEIKPRSMTIDPCKSARKMSLHDDSKTSECFKLLSSLATSDKQIEASCSLNLNITNIPETSTSLFTQENYSSLESLHEQSNQDCHPMSSASYQEVGRNMSASDEHFVYENAGYNKNDEHCTELTDGVDNNAQVDKLVNDTNNECTDNFDTNTSHQITDGDRAASDTDVDIIQSRELCGSSKYNAENTISLDTSDFSNGKCASANTSGAHDDAGARCGPKEGHIRRQDNLENIEPLSFVKKQQDDESNATSPHDHCASVRNEANYSQTAAAWNNSNLLNRMNQEENIPKVETVSPDGEADKHDVATTYSIISNDVDDINNDIIQNLNGSSDEESTGVKVTDSDISDILDNSNDESEPEDNGDELGDLHTENLSSNNPVTMFVLQQDDENNDTDV